MTAKKTNKDAAEDIVDNSENTDGKTGAEEAGAKEKASVATQLVQLAQSDYYLGCTPDGDPYAIPLNGPPIVRLLRGGRQSLRAELARKYYATKNAAASQSALADACTAIEGQAGQVEPVELHLRVARHYESLVLDLGDATGRCVVITSNGWQVTDNPPVRFKRTALTGPLPEPVRGGDFESLWSALNLAERYRPVLQGVLVAELIPDMPHPVVLLSGEQGTGKSTTTARCASIVDPSPAQVRKAPRDADSWTTAAAGSWVVALDNLSAVPDWLSDSLCRASTGDGDVRRRLYTDGDLHVIAFRRAVFVNGIDLGALRGDLADRLVHLALERITDDNRRSDAEMAAEWREAHPKVLGALLDLTADVLAKLPSIKVERAPRMADFAKVLAAVDAINGTKGLDVYRGLRNELAEDAATSDPVLIALAKCVTEEWTDTSAVLLAKIHPNDDGGNPVDARNLPKGWPTAARALTTILTRQAPTLRQLGWTVEKLDKSTDPRGKAVRWRLVPPPKPAEPAKEDDGKPREGEKDAANAADAANDLFSQLNGHAATAANGAATVPRTSRDAAPAATSNGRGNHAAPDAATPAPGLTSANEDHAATAASTASDTYPLGSPPCEECGEPMPGAEPGDACMECYISGRVAS